MASIVIAGGGLAAAKAAQTLRDEEFDGEIVLLGAAPERPYERPPLTKDYLRDESPREKAYVHPEAFYREHEIELMTGTAVTGVDLPARGSRLRTDASSPTTSCCWRPAPSRAGSQSRGPI